MIMDLTLHPTLCQWADEVGLLPLTTQSRVYTLLPNRSPDLQPRPRRKAMRREVICTQPSEIFPFGSPYSEADREESFSQVKRTRSCWQDSSCRRSRVLYLITTVAGLGLLALLLTHGERPLIGKHAINVLKRQDSADGSSPSNSEGGTSTTSKVVGIIFAIVGVLLLIYTSFALTSYCCRSAFKKRWCFPCYACASCGGLRCLECCGCGLCFIGLANWGPGSFDEDEEYPMNTRFDGRFGDGRDQARDNSVPV